MHTTELRVAKIGNSRGVRLPVEVLRRYAFTGAAIIDKVEVAFSNWKKRVGGICALNTSVSHRM